MNRGTYMNATTGTLYASDYRPLARRATTPELVGNKTIAVLSFAYCVAGTMGLVTPQSLEQRTATTNAPVHYETDKADAIFAAQSIALEPTPAQALARIREVLKPAVLELANLFGVSRQAVYAWQDGARPAPEAAARLAMLTRAADVFATAGVAADTQTLRRKVAGGGTVLDAVLTGGDAVQVARSLVQTLQREAVQRERLTKQFAGRKRGPAAADDYGTPAVAEGA